MHACFLSAGKLIHRAVEIIVGKAKPLQHTAQAALVAVAVILFKIMLQSGIFLHFFRQRLSAQISHFVF